MKIALCGMLGILLMSGATVAPASDNRGNGGDVVLCGATHGDFELPAGYYALDYLLTINTVNEAQTTRFDNLAAALQSITNAMDAKLPTLARSFKTFIADYRNTTDPTHRYFWDEAPFGLDDIADENRVNDVPPACKTNGSIQLIQAVVHQNSEQAGLPQGTIGLKFVPSLLIALERDAPLQLSFLLVHEWLWDLSQNVDRNRRINRFLHSREFATMTSEQAVARLKSFGFNADGTSPPVDPDASIAVLDCNSAVGTLLVGPRLERRCQSEICPVECAGAAFDVRDLTRRGQSSDPLQGHMVFKCACKVEGMGEGPWRCQGARSHDDIQLYNGTGQTRFAAEMAMYAKCGSRKDCSGAQMRCYTAQLN